MKRCKKFVSEKSLATGLAFGGSILLFLILFANNVTQSSFSIEILITSLLLLALTALFAWIWFGTHYRLTNNTLLYRSGPIHGTINIHAITQVKPKERLWSGLKPALGMHGLVVCYNRWDEIYISPKDKSEFISQLLQVNPQIAVVD